MQIAANHAGNEKQSFILQLLGVRWWWLVPAVRFSPVDSEPPEPL